MVNWRNRVWLSRVCPRKVSSTTKPRSAIRVAGRRACFRLSEPQRRRALSQVAGVPGTPTLTPLDTRSANAYGLPVAGSTKASSGMAAGAVSRPSRVETRPVEAS